MLSARQALLCVDELKSSIESLAARYEKLNEEFRQQSVKEQRRCELALEAQSRELSSAIAEAEDLSRSATSTEKTRYEQ